MTSRTKIVVFGNQKGGVGKTTLSVGVAGAWAESGYKVLFVDADPQRSASEQLKRHPVIQFAKHIGGGLDELLPSLDGDFHIIVVDTPSGVNEALSSALRVATLLIIPVKPSPYDFMSAETTLEIAKQANVPAMFVVNESDSRTRFTKQAPEALKGYGVRVLKQSVAYRSAHREVVMLGMAITDVNLNGGKAANEIRALAREISIVLEDTSDRTSFR
jgi:chromosome partitioning protein